MKRSSLFVVLFCVISVLTLWSQTQVSLPRFGTTVGGMKVWDLGTYSGGLYAWANDINDFGLAVGAASLSGFDQQRPMMIPLLGPSAMQWVDLGTLGGEGSQQAQGISNTGIIVGHSTTSAGDDHAFVWTSQTGIVDLGTLPIPGHNMSMANHVNRNGTLIVGWSGFSDWSDVRPVVWTPSTHGLVTTWQIHQLDVTALGNYISGQAFSVNRRGLVAGNAWGDSGSTGVLWTPVRDGQRWMPVQLGSAEYPIVTPSQQQINDHDELVGTGWTGLADVLVVGKPVGGEPKAYTFTPLAIPEGWNGAWASGINNQGDISGVVYDENGNYYGAQWSTKDPKFIRVMPTFTGQVWSFLAGLNESGIAVGGYGGVSDEDGSYFQHGVAVQFH